MTPEILEAELEALRRGGVTLTRADLDASLLGWEADGFFVDAGSAPAVAPASFDALDPVTLSLVGGPINVCYGGWPASDGGTPRSEQGRRL